MTVPTGALYELAEAPAAYSVVVSVATGEPWDPTTVTSAVLLMSKPDGTEVSWSTTLSAASPSSITLTHILAASGADLPRGSAGTWVCRPKLTLPSGVVYGRPFNQYVAEAFET